MGASTLAERMNLPLQEAKQIINDFYEGFKGVKKLTDDSQDMLKKYGYVTDMWGRRRHIPDAQLPEYEIRSINQNTTFNPLLDTPAHVDNQLEAKINFYKNQLSKVKWKADKDKIIEEAKKDGLEIKSNGGFINRALRQCLNARIQGTAASMTKAAMVLVNNDKELKDLGFQLLATIHDEMYGKAPTENAEKAAKRLSELMVQAAADKCVCKFKCDPYIVKRWYEDEFSAEVLKDFNKLINKNIDHDSAVNKMKEKYSMIKPEYIEMMCNDTFDPNTYEDI